jgi:hypothetical protein
MSIRIQIGIENGNEGINFLLCGCNALFQYSYIVTHSSKRVGWYLTVGICAKVVLPWMVNPLAFLCNLVLSFSSTIIQTN